MRVTGGQFAGRPLQAPKGPRIRTTLDHIRQALFNLLGQRVAGARVLDLFSGSGALGIEALSRGAAHVAFVDRSGFSIQAIRANLENLYQPGIAGGTAARRRPHPAPEPRVPAGPFRIIRADAAAAVRRLANKGEAFDLAFLDPPYRKGLARKSLLALARDAILSFSGLVVVEHDKRDPLPAQIEGGLGRLALQRSQRYGDSALTIYQRQ